jgi:uncharacterized membrane protein YeaQ/YmgE (transglycosylase-associated protein family)
VKKEVVCQDEAQRVWATADTNGNAIPSTLTTYQTVTGKWQAALTAIVAGVGLASLLSGHTVFETLSAVWQAGFVAAFVVAIIGNAAVLVISDLASFGFPTLGYVVKNGKKLDEADLAPLKSARKAQTKMWWSLALAVPTIAASIAGASILLF